MSFVIAAFLLKFKERKTRRKKEEQKKKEKRKEMKRIGNALVKLLLYLSRAGAASQLRYVFRQDQRSRGR